MIKAGGRQRTDSTQVLAAVRSVNRLEFLTETLRAALEALAAAAPDWLGPRIDADWVHRYGARADVQRPETSHGLVTHRLFHRGWLGGLLAAPDIDPKHRLPTAFAELALAI